VRKISVTPVVEICHKEPHQHLSFVVDKTKKKEFPGELSLAMKNKSCTPRGENTG
jgi:hypothetical protein